MGAGLHLLYPEGNTLCGEWSEGSQWEVQNAKFLMYSGKRNMIKVDLSTEGHMYFYMTTQG